MLLHNFNHALAYMIADAIRFQHKGLLGFNWKDVTNNKLARYLVNDKAEMIILRYIL